MQQKAENTGQINPASFVFSQTLGVLVCRQENSIVNITMILMKHCVVDEAAAAGINNLGSEHKVILDFINQPRVHTLVSQSSYHLQL